jgi:hypothetical protein
MLDAAIRAYADAKRFSPATLERWIGCARPDRKALLSLAEALRLGENQFRDVFDQAREIAARRQCDIAEVLGTAPIRDILARGLGRNEAVRALKQSLRRLRYPQLAATEERLAGMVKALGLPSGVEVRFPENLEGEEISLHLRARSAAQFRERVARLTSALQRAEVDEIFRVMEGDW